MATYYYAEGGTAANKEAATSGTYPGGCMSVTVHNSESFSPGDSVLASDQGGPIRTQLNPPSAGISGFPITYGAKSGESPILAGSDLITGWTATDGESNVWEATLATENEETYMDGTWGDSVADIASLANEYDWVWVSGKLYIYSATDPDTTYTSPGVEASAREHCIVTSNNDNYLIFENLTMRHANRSELRLRPATGNIIRDCEMHHGHMGIEWNNQNNLLIQRCHVHDGDWNGIFGGSTWGGGDPTSNIIIEQCLVEDNAHNGIDLHCNGTGANVSDITVRHCRMTGQTDSGLYLSHGFQSTVQISDVKIYGCVSYKNGLGGIAISHDAQDPATNQVYIYNNTCYGNGTRNSGAGIQGRMQNSVIKNNILAENQDSATNTWEISVDDAGGTANTADYNCLYSSTQTNVAKWDGTVRTYANWVSLDGQNANGINADPKFADPSSDDYTLQSDSPCIGAGETLGSPYNSCLMPTSSWPSGVVTGDQDDY